VTCLPTSYKEPEPAKRRPPHPAELLSRIGAAARLRELGSFAAVLAKRQAPIKTELGALLLRCGRVGVSGEARGVST